ncbi:MAG: biotin--[acetyl-CoA-carboxylase] ligase [Treponema sp.]|nr:biotin--[acetyl-CoA-carboxylase] ligase [Treponema sp.]
MAAPGQTASPCSCTDPAPKAESGGTEDVFTLKNFYEAFTEESARLGLDGPRILPADRVTLLDETDSTNTRLLSLLDAESLPTCTVQAGDGPASSGPLLDAGGRLTCRGRDLAFTLVAAASQTAGRGRVGRRFWSPDGSGIYFSFIYIPRGGLTDPGRITAAAAVAVCRAVDALYGIRSGIKWVNDVYVGGKKVSGILTEGWAPAAASDAAPATDDGSTPNPPAVQAAVIGIGINIRAGSSFPEELSSKAGGLADEAVRLGCPADRAASVTRPRLLAACMAQVLRILTAGENIRDEYAARSILTGRNVTVIPLVGDERSRYTARVLGIGKNLGLLVKTADGTERELTSGEVSLSLE